jgi:hypothetical protein
LGLAMRLHLFGLDASHAIVLKAGFHIRSLAHMVCIAIIRDVIMDMDADIMGVFGLRNHCIQIEVVHHEFIPQIWWNDSISHISTN